jgi:hypothetical protein
VKTVETGVSSYNNCYVDGEVLVRNILVETGYSTRIKCEDNTHLFRSSLIISPHTRIFPSSFFFPANVTLKIVQSYFLGQRGQSRYQIHPKFALLHSESLPVFVTSRPWVIVISVALYTYKHIFLDSHIVSYFDHWAWTTRLYRNVDTDYQVK